MGRIIKKALLYIGSTEGLFFIIISTLLFSVQFILHQSFMAATRSIFTTFVICIIVCPILLRYAESIKIPSCLKTTENNKPLEIFLYVLPFLVLIYQYIIYYPGAFSSDSYHQYTDAITGNYRDWHPFLHTLLFFKLPLLLTNGWVGSIVLFQIILFSLVIAYTVKTLKEYINIKIVAVIIIWIIINPQTLNLAIYAWKDIAFAMGTLLLADFAVHIYFTDGKWINKIPNTVFLIVIIALTTLVRHNGILFTLPYVFAIMFFISKKRTAIILIGIIVIIGGVKSPLYKALDVQPLENRQEETLGLPISVMYAVAAYAPDSLDEKTKEDIYRLTPKSVIEKSYDYCGYNSIKWNEANNNALISEYGTKKIITLALKCAKASPKVAFKEFIYITCGTYGLLNEYIFSLKNNRLYFHLPYVDKRLDFEITGIPPLQELSRIYTQLCIVILPYIFVSVGLMQFILLFAILAKKRLRNKEGRKRVLFVLPVLAYNFGTMLLLSSATDTIRFFYYTFLVTPLILLILTKKNESKV